MEQTTGNSQKVTNAKLWAKLDAMDQKLGKLDDVCEHVIKCEVRWQAHRDTHTVINDELKAVKDSKGWLAALGVAVTAGVAAVGSWLKQ